VRTMVTTFKMNKRVFRTLAYIMTTPQNKLNKTPLDMCSCEGKYSIVHGEVHLNNHTLTDIRNISRLSEPLTGKVALVNISPLVFSGQVKVPQKYVISKYWEDEYDGSAREDHYSFLHTLRNIKVASKANMNLEEAEAKGGVL
jgi:hypothetical protein